MNQPARSRLEHFVLKTSHLKLVFVSARMASAVATAQVIVIT